MCAVGCARSALPAFIIIINNRVARIERKEVGLGEQLEFSPAVVLLEMADPASNVKRDAVVQDRAAARRGSGTNRLTTRLSDEVKRARIKRNSAAFYARGKYARASSD